MSATRCRQARKLGVASGEGKGKNGGMFDCHQQANTTVTAEEVEASCRRSNEKKKQKVRNQEMKEKKKMDIENSVMMQTAAHQGGA